MKTIQRFGDTKIRVKPVTRDGLSPKEKLDRRQAMRELTRETPEALAHREVLKRQPLQKLIAAAIEQGFFDRLKVTNG